MFNSSRFTKNEFRARESARHRPTPLGSTRDTERLVIAPQQPRLQPSTLTRGMPHVYSYFWTICVDLQTHNFLDAFTRQKGNKCRQSPNRPRSFPYVFARENPINTWRKAEQVTSLHFTSSNTWIACIRGKIFVLVRRTYVCLLSRQTRAPIHDTARRWVWEIGNKIHRR